MNTPDIKKLITRLGGPTAVSKVIDRTHGAVCQWTTVPTEHLKALEAWSVENGDPISREEMRPDLFDR